MDVISVVVLGGLGLAGMGLLILMRRLGGRSYSRERRKNLASYFHILGRPSPGD